MRMDDPRFLFRNSLVAISVYLQNQHPAMARISSLLNMLQHRYLFYGVLLLNVAVLFSTKFFTSMDGPAHLYNARLLLEIITGNEVIDQFYAINTVPIPNWTSHFLLTLFTWALPAWLAEKCYLILYVAGMAFSFRYLIHQLAPQNISLSILIFPVIYSFLFYLGFYNFTFSFIFLFLILGFYVENHQKKTFKKYLLLGFLLTATYFTNVLVFGFVGITLGVYILAHSFLFRSAENHTFAAKSAVTELLLLLVAALPGLLCLAVFYSKVTFFGSAEAYSIRELLKWLNDARPFIAYNYDEEVIFTEQIFHVILLLIGISIFMDLARSTFKWQSVLKKVDILFIPLLILMILYVVTPNGASAGMMSDRYCLMIFVFATMWAVCRAVPGRFNGVIVLFTVLFHLALLAEHNKYRFSNPQTINNADSHIAANSIVLPVNLSDHWLEPHFSNYLGVDKPMMILENYETAVGWFPVKWDDNMPAVLLGEKTSITGFKWRSGSDQVGRKQIDHILLYGNMEKINTPSFDELRGILAKGFKLKHSSPDGYLMLYEQI